MEVKPGYKQTEVGVIPEDWEVAQIGHLKPFADQRFAWVGSLLRSGVRYLSALRTFQGRTFTETKTRDS